MHSPADFFAEARAFEGQPYSFGAEIPTSADPFGVGPVDCSELTSVAARRIGLAGSVPDGAYNQWAACGNAGLLVPVDQARATYGALLFYDDGTGTGRDRVTHVAISMGDGRTFEAWQDGKPVGYYDANRSKFTVGGLVPGIDYGATAPVPPSTGGSWETLRNLYETSPRMQGPDVTAAQILLRGWGQNPGDIDGVYGPMCAEACRGYQASVGLAADGQFGPDTRSRANGA